MSIAEKSPAPMTVAAASSELPAAPMRAPARPCRAAPSPVEPEMSAEQALCAIADATGRMVERNALIVLSSDDPKGPHQLRVGLRRLRACLKAHRPTLDRERVRPLEDWARELAAAAGAWRDADVLIDAIVAPAEADGALGGGAASLRRALEADRKRIREESRAKLIDLDPAAFLDLLSDSVAERRWRIDPADREARKTAARQAARLDGSARKHAKAALERLWRRVGRWGARIDTLDIPERHEMRKELKTLRYAIQHFAPLFARDPAEVEAAAGFATATRRLQNQFGYLNDVAAAEALRDRYGGGASKRAAAAEAALAWHEARAEAAWEKALRRWDDALAAPAFWRPRRA